MSASENTQTYFDLISPYCVRGWCAIPSRPDTRVQIELLNKTGKVLASCVSDMFRQDLLNAGIGNGDGKYAFELKGDFRNVNRIRVVVPVEIPMPNFASLEIHEEDSLFWNFYFSCQGNLDGGLKAAAMYADDGMNSANMLRTLCQDILHIKKRNLSLLEFNSGFGKVTCGLDKSVFSVTASDIQAPAMEFIQNKLGVDTYLAPMDASQFNPGKTFDIVFALSAFAHFDKSAFDKWLKALYNCVSSDGYFIFTTHGAVSNESMRYELKNGFMYKENEAPVTGREKKAMSDFGASVATKEYVEAACKRVLNTAPLISKEGYWWKHQDLYIIKKSGT